MSEAIITGAAKLMESIASSRGQSIPWAEALEMGRQLVARGVELFDASLKKKAEAAGDAAGAAVTTEDAAEAAQRQK